MTGLSAEVKTYLAKLEDELRELGVGERDEIVDELRATFAEKVERGDAEPLEGFPSPAEYAEQFRRAADLDASEDDESDRTSPSRSASDSGPVAIGRLFVFALVGVPIALVCALAGTAILGTGIAKIFAFDQAGLFRDASGAIVHFGVLREPPGEEVFGWTGIPLFLLAGAALVLAAYALTRRGLAWTRRR